MDILTACLPGYLGGISASSHLQSPVCDGPDSDFSLKLSGWASPPGAVSFSVIFRADFLISAGVFPVLPQAAPFVLEVGSSACPGVLGPRSFSEAACLSAQSAPDGSPSGSTLSDNDPAIARFPLDGGALRGHGLEIAV